MTSDRSKKHNLNWFNLILPRFCGLSAFSREFQVSSWTRAPWHIHADNARCDPRVQFLGTWPYVSNHISISSCLLRGIFRSSFVEFRSAEIAKPVICVLSLSNYLWWSIVVASVPGIMHGMFWEFNQAYSSTETCLYGCAYHRIRTARSLSWCRSYSFRWASIQR